MNGKSIRSSIVFIQITTDLDGILNFGSGKIYLNETNECNPNAHC